ncbi:M24 family metallopeptidase [Haladaptatus pallidirubidus]|nr:M24 family metallopeptidase [Haladaptatus pallidirubidus]
MVSRYESLQNAIEQELEAYDADAFVHIGDRFDDLLRYCTHFSGPDRDYAFVYGSGQSVLCAPRLFGEQAEREFIGDIVRTDHQQNGSTPVIRAIETINELTAAARILLPSHVSHRVISVLEDDFEVCTTDTDFGRAQKTSNERTQIESVQTAAQHGMAHAEAILAETEVQQDTLHWKGEMLTTERLRREVNAVLAKQGVQDAGNTVIGAGRSCSDLHFTGNDEIRTGETVLLDISPRGKSGYYADLTRTFVVGIDTWTRTAYDAVRDAQDAALAALDNGEGTEAKAVHQAASAVLSDHGFAVGDVSVGMYHGTGHGVGLSLHEAPSLSSDELLKAGHVITVEPGVYDPEKGGVRIEDLIMVTQSSYENLTDYPRCLVPSSR